MLRHGFYGKPLSLEQIGNYFNVTKERIRQIEKIAIIKIRESDCVKEFSEYMQRPDESLENIDKFCKKKRKTRKYTRK